MSRAEEFFSSTFYILSNFYWNWFTEDIFEMYQEKQALLGKQLKFLF